ncbi:MAG: FKBP-type peptidyl-prolyl cis-trans isomerase [Bacteroidetes bacterium]|nr:FKBP-type peptidyl-prolyl cis-trans isomerase [Bacteroidota bacterium]
MFGSLFFLLLCFCKGPAIKEEDKIKTQKPINEEELKNQFVRANKQLVQKESDEMDYYVKTHKMPFVRTTSGIRYYVYKPSAHGDSIKDKEEIVMNFKVSLLDGTECYSSKTEGKKTFIVGNEDIESGIHRGVKYLKHGDKALLLIPSHLAHGLLGDFKKIPPQMPIIYDVEIY